jgi:uracil-DNA glycosylase
VARNCPLKPPKMNLEKISQLIDKTDSRGNYIRLAPNLEILLKDAGSKERRIGTVVEKNGQVVYYKREDEAEIHRKSKSWSINRCVLEAVDAVEYETDKAIYKITAKEAHHHGLSFKWDNKSFVDKKCFVPIMHWSITWKNHPSNTLINNFGYEWYSELENAGILAKDYFVNMFPLLRKLYTERQVFPAKENLFLPYRLTSFMSVKVVVVAPAAFPSSGSNGLAYGFEGTGSVPASTTCFIKAIEQDVYQGCLKLDNDLSMKDYAAQGVLFLNYIPVVEKIVEHYNMGWEKFHEDIIKILNVKKENLVFMLYGQSIVLKEYITLSKHLVLQNNVIYTPDYIPGKYFTDINNYLISKKKIPINW